MPPCDAPGITAREVRYIKLGDGGRWAEQAIDDGTLCFGYHLIPHEICAAGDWGAVRSRLADRKSAGAQTASVNEIRTFYQTGADCLWITFAHGHLYWAFAAPEVHWTWDGISTGPSRIRHTLNGWRNTDSTGQPLRTPALSSRLTQVANFRATICKVAQQAYLLRRLNAIPEPIVRRAATARSAMIAVAVEMIRGLHWADFETLTDLIFARAGWQRSTRVGETLTDIDLVMQQPTTDEVAFVQVKSTANQAVLDDYLERFRRSGHDRFFFVCHTAQGRLALPDERNLHLFEGPRLAEVAVKNGLYDWLIERSS